ncbi:MAG: glycosyltransferase [Phycisphaerae bacterium]|nr:glycosyltransferase [Phycisphaerae bacterium]
MTKSAESTERRRSLLCVAYAFAPVLRSGTHRTLAFVRHLDRRGWDSTVITVQPDGEPADLDLLSRVPERTRVIRTHWAPLTEQFKRFCGRMQRPRPARVNGPTRSGTGEAAGVHRGLRDWFSRLLLTPDSRLGWVLPGLAATRGRRVDAVYSTSPFPSAHLIAMLAAMRLRRPWVADFRDPWGGNPFRDLGYASLAAWDGFLERRVLRRASRIVCNTPTLQRNLARRLPWTAAKAVTLPNGYDLDVIESTRPIRDVGDDAFVLVHTGNFYGNRSPIPLLRGLRLAAEQNADVARRAKVVFVGDPTYDGQRIERLATAAGVAGLVQVLGVRPHAEVIGRLRGADASIVVGLDGPGSDLQVPNKLYEYLAVRRPVLALAPREGAIADVLADAVADNLVCSPQDEGEIALGIEWMVRRGGGFVDGAWSGVDRYDRRHAAEGLARLLDELIGARRSARSADACAAAGQGGVACVP